MRTAGDYNHDNGNLVCGQPHGSRSGHFLSVVEKSSGPRIAPDRVSSEPTRFPGSAGMILMAEYATIGPIDAKCEHF